MTSSKRPYHHGQIPESQSEETNSKRVAIESDPCYFSETSWLELWTSLIDVDQNYDAAGTSFDGWYDPLCKVEQRIDSWAASAVYPHDVVQDRSLDTEERTQETGEVCFGMIHNVQSRLIGDMSSHQKRLMIDQTSLHRSFDVAPRTQEMELIYDDGTSFAQLNQAATEALGEIFNNIPLRLEAFVGVHSCLKVLERAKRPGDAVVAVDINVYGTSDSLEEAGKQLSANRLYLQHPDHRCEDVEYRNPHMISLPGYPSTDTGSCTFIQEENRPNEGNFEETISEVYCSLKRSGSLHGLKADAQIKSVLFQHQEQALDFMVQREQDTVPDEFRLWDPTASDSEIRYHHRLTGFTSEEIPDESRGGILADQMGMGKTLSTLALVTRSREDAAQWARREAVSTSKPVSCVPSRATLIIVPTLMILNSWSAEIHKHLTGSLRVLKYHGQRRETLIDVIRDAEIVLTTYHTLASDKGCNKNPLGNILWFRIVLDEAHTIRRQATTLHQAAAALDARFRWCLTGTPIQNRLEDLGSLIAFLRAAPLDSMSTFRKHIILPFLEDTSAAKEKLVQLLDSLCLRQTQDLIDLPKAVEIWHEVDFSPQERRQYDWTLDTMARALRYDYSPLNGKHPPGAFQIQLQLRLLCNHGTYQRQFAWTNDHDELSEIEDALLSLGSGGIINCSSCEQSMSSLAYKPCALCRHVICDECEEQADQQQNIYSTARKQCAFCHAGRAPVGSGVQADSARKNENSHGNFFRPDGQSSKIVALMNDINQNISSTKSIVFSCWTRTLDLIDQQLCHMSIRFERIDGGCPLGQRQGILDRFSLDSNIPVLLMSTGTGAFGLNLTAANRIFIVEPQWNPSVEDQAIARALRIGQKNRVVVTRYTVRETVEEVWLNRNKGSLFCAD